MSMKPLHANRPMGEFDGLDSEVNALLGGEVVGWTTTALPSGDLAAFDSKDGYSGTTSKVRPVVTKTLVAGMRPLMLADEGILGYGTMLGSVVGGTVGQVVTGGMVLGPSTAAGSGKVTLWDEPGLYAISLDAVDTTVLTGLVPGNGGLLPGAPLYATSAGKLTPNVSASFESVKVASFVYFEDSVSLVSTPNSLVAALNSPVGNVSSLKPAPSFTQAVVHFIGGNLA